MFHTHTHLRQKEYRERVLSKEEAAAEPAAEPDEPADVSAADMAKRCVHSRWIVSAPFRLRCCVSLSLSA
jgi:hypothetical protein